ncbi:MAG TPA: hypothetical protein VJ001_13795, partial [Rhodocyclaceae bacterium]|nr:hypothetical protein [Rhodocyclaceae bacterium]
MPKIGKLILTLVLLAMFVMALLYALRGQQAAVELQQEQAAPELNGLIALDVEPYFKDERVRRILA